jgi:hypothetical protein
MTYGRIFLRCLPPFLLTVVMAVGVPYAWTEVLKWH